MNERPRPILQLRPTLAELHAISTDSLVTVESRRGRAEFHTEITPDIRPDTLFAAFHWGGPDSANALTNMALDPISRMPEYKLAAVRIARVRHTE